MPPEEEFNNELENFTAKLRKEQSYAAQYKILAEMKDFADQSLKDEVIYEEYIYSLYLDIAKEYFYLGHYCYAMELYEKVMEWLGDDYLSVARDSEMGEDFVNKLESAFEYLLRIYRCMSQHNKKEEYDAKAAKLIRLFEYIHFQFTEKAIERANKERRVKNDPVEYTEAYISILPELEAKIEARLGGIERGMGFCHRYWHAKGEILKKDYNIDWDSPGVLNPGTRFD